MLIKPSYFLTSARNGLILFADTVLPSLFPFLICTTLLTSIGTAEIMAKALKKPMRVLFRTNENGAFVAFSSYLSGYPVGAILTNKLYKNGTFSSDDCKRVISFSSTSGPIFMIGTVGSAIFQNQTVGIIILVSHYLSAIINGVIFGRIKAKNDSLPMAKCLTDTSDNAVANAVSSSANAMLSLCGYIVVANMIIDAIDLALVGANIYLKAVIFGIVEMTRGCIFASKLPLLFAVPLASAFISFGGLSIIMQSTAFLSECNVRPSEFVLRKFCQSLTSFVISILFTLFLV